MSDDDRMARVAEWWERARVRWLEYRRAAAEGRATAAALEARFHNAARKLAEAVAEGEPASYWGRNELVAADPPEAEAG